MTNEKNELKNQVKDILNKYFKEALKSNILKYKIEEGWLTIEFKNNLTSEGKDFNFKLLCAQSIADYINEMGYIDELALINRITLMLAESLRSANQDVNILMTEEK